MRFLALILAVLLAIPAAYAQAPQVQVAEDDSVAPILSYTGRFHPIVAKNGMVVSQERLASEVGVEILKAGGNAVDAAVAVGFALAPVHPLAGNLGGGGFMVVHMAPTESDEGKTTSIDFREVAPLAATRDMYLDADGNPDRTKTRSRLAVGVPGTVKGMVHALETYGTMSLEEVMAPAIRLADEGMIVEWGFHLAVTTFGRGRLKGDPESAKIFFKADGTPYGVGERIYQKDLAWSLKEIARTNGEAFYTGSVAKKLAADMAKNGGLITLEDLAAYKIVERAPVTGTFRGYTIAAMPPPSSGGIHMIQMLNILEGYDLKSMGHNSAAYLHLLTESMRSAYADRSKWIGDPDFVPVPVKALTSKAYATQIRNTISMDRARPSESIRPAATLPHEGEDTTHYSIVDGMGNAVSTTYTLNSTFGTGITAEGTGFLLNNELLDFALAPGRASAFGLVTGEANAIVPQKRPLSSMTPTIVFKDGKPVILAGSPGGSLIITSVTQTLLNSLEFEMNIAEAVARPRIHHQWLPDRMSYEPGISADTLGILDAMGHTERRERAGMGSVQAIVIGDGWFYGAGDPRRPNSAALGY